MKNSNKSLTVLMPVFNGETYLREAIDSVLNQTFSDFDLLIIDDSSTDSSAKIIEAFSEKDSRIKYVRNDLNKGLIRSLNQGLALTSTPFLARHDADDLSLPERFEKQLQYLNSNPDIALLGTSFEIIGPSRPFKKVLLPRTHEQICENLIYGNCFAHGSIMLRTDSFKTIGGYSTLPIADHIEDYEAWSRVIAKYRAANLPDILYSYRIHEESLSTRNQPELFRHTVELSKQLVSRSQTVPSPSIYSFPRANDPDFNLRREQNLPNLFQVIKLLWKSGKKPAALSRLLFMAAVQPKFFGKAFSAQLRAMK